MSISHEKPVLSLGRRVHCILYGGRDGRIVRIHGEQQPETIESLCGGAVVMGGGAEFDIVWDDGTESPRVPESIVHGVQWRIYDEIESADEILDAIRLAKNKKAQLSEQREATIARRESERRQHLADSPHLTPKTAKPDYSPGRLAAHNMRIELKRAFPGVKFSVRSDFNSVNVRWTNGPTQDQVDSIVQQYKAGSFDGMTDCYNVDADATFAQVFGDPNYVFTDREFSNDDLEEIARDFCRLREIEFNSMNDYIDCGPGLHLWSVARALLKNVDIRPGQSIVGLDRTDCNCGSWDEFYRVVLK